MPDHERVRTLERFWRRQLDRIKARSEEKMRKFADQKQVRATRKEGQ